MGTHGSLRGASSRELGHMGFDKVLHRGDVRPPPAPAAVTAALLCDPGSWQRCADAGVCTSCSWDAVFVCSGQCGRWVVAINCCRPVWWLGCLWQPCSHLLAGRQQCLACSCTVSRVCRSTCVNGQRTRCWRVTGGLWEMVTAASSLHSASMYCEECWRVPSGVCITQCKAQQPHLAAS